MFFDFFALKIRAESKASDEVFFGYIFGKTGEKVEYRFICIPRRFSKQVSVDLNSPLSTFKEFLNHHYQELFTKTPEVMELTTEFMRYLEMQIKKTGGREAFSVRYSKVIADGDFDVVKMELLNLFQNWTTSLDIDLVVDTSTYEELTSSYLKDIDFGDFAQSLSSRNDLVTLPEIYPIVDPLDGASIDEYDIGDTLFCTLLGFTAIDQEKLLREEFPDHFDAEGNNTVPFEGVIISKEILPLISKNFVLVKVQIGKSFQAKSMVLRSIRLMYDPNKMRKRLQSIKQDADTHSISVADAMSKYKKVREESSKKLLDSGKVRINDFVLTLIFLMLIFGLVAIILYYFFLT
ncbi:MAG TPA: DUF4899 domain-containing protein [Thermotogota bacterium]|jgi:hypothetical protein|nr:DUF4899 domain-containing protein [Thermotogota bacterium]NLH19400.1 DUF4899 domain-containing protein [Thermotogaceae bacterium]OQC31186.1 MAG: hypothetical protein BWX67_01279 [Thermotogota bacterium ADurb.Bin062]HNW47217.1 DUF4899 domain-containing protein [Thermotogota bacterium]HNY82820.1 DUF4899 domain-containing protein [Thermotogota bacterium]